MPFRWSVSCWTMRAGQPREHLVDRHGPARPRGQPHLRVAGHHGLAARHAQAALEERRPGRRPPPRTTGSPAPGRAAGPGRAPAAPPPSTGAGSSIDREPERHAHLRRGEADARRRVHRRAQGGDEPGQQPRVQLAVEAAPASRAAPDRRPRRWATGLRGEEFLDQVAQGRTVRGSRSDAIAPGCHGAPERLALMCDARHSRGPEPGAPSSRLLGRHTRERPLHREKPADVHRSPSSRHGRGATTRRRPGTVPRQMGHAAPAGAASALLRRSARRPVPARRRRHRLPVRRYVPGREAGVRRRDDRLRRR